MKRYVVLGLSGILAACRAKAPPGASASGVPTASALAWPVAPLASQEATLGSSSAGVAVFTVSSVSIRPPPTASGATSSAPAPHVVDPANRGRPPLESEALTTSAAQLFEAIRDNDPTGAAGFFFPRDPFLPLKDMAEPGRYWDTLFRVYQNDIRELHRKHSGDLAGATFVAFALGSPPTWVKPGEEANKIGYFRTFNGKLRYRTASGSDRSFEVKTIISWDGGWYITHLLPIKRLK